MTHLLAGLIFLILGTWGIIGWWEEFGMFLRAMVPIMLVLIGLAAIGAGFKSFGGKPKIDGDEEPVDA